LAPESEKGYRIVLEQQKENKEELKKLGQYVREFAIWDAAGRVALGGNECRCD
jgi:hypothetical protein